MECVWLFENEVVKSLDLKNSIYDFIWKTAGLAIPRIAYKNKKMVWMVPRNYATIVVLGKSEEMPYFTPMLKLISS